MIAPRPRAYPPPSVRRTQADAYRVTRGRRFYFLTCLPARVAAGFVPCVCCGSRHTIAEVARNGFGVVACNACGAS